MGLKRYEAVMKAASASFASPFRCGVRPFSLLASRIHESEQPVSREGCVGKQIS